MATPNLRTLVPQPPEIKRVGKGSSASRYQPKSIARRCQVIAACNSCRQRRSKCDGARPSCGLCTFKGSKCIYDVDEGVSRTHALKKRNESLATQVEELEQVISRLRTASPTEAIDFLRFIRNTRDSAELTNYLQMADLKHDPGTNKEALLQWVLASAEERLDGVAWQNPYHPELQNADPSPNESLRSSHSLIVNPSPTIGPYSPMNATPTYATPYFVEPTPLGHRPYDRPRHDHPPIGHEAYAYPQLHHAPLALP